MGALQALIYVALGTVAIVLVSGLVGLIRGHVSRIHYGESRLDVARHRYEAGEIGERELELTRRRQAAA